MVKHPYCSIRVLSVAFGILSAAAVVLSSGCVADGVQENVQPEEAQPEQQPTEIELIEQQLGVSLVKETKTIVDEHQNSVTLLVASQHGELVENFMNNVEVSIETPPTPDMPPPNESTLPPGTQPKEEAPRVDRLMLEVISKSFGPDTKAFTLKFHGKRSISIPPGTDLSAFDVQTYESELFIEGFQISYQSFNCGGCGNAIKVQHFSRACALCSYKLWAEKTLVPGQSWASCHDARRTKAVISTAYGLSLYTWSFTFWNCA